jgi:hypothetical protein
MIKYENDMLVLDPSHTKEDQIAINKFIEKISNDAFDKGFEAGTKTIQHPPQNFRDIGNGE